MARLHHCRAATQDLGFERLIWRKNRGTPGPRDSAGPTRLPSGGRRCDAPLTGATKGSLPAVGSEAGAGLPTWGAESRGRCSRLPAPQLNARRRGLGGKQVLDVEQAVCRGEAG